MMKRPHRKRYAPPAMEPMDPLCWGAHFNGLQNDSPALRRQYDAGYPLVLYNQRVMVSEPIPMRPGSRMIGCYVTTTEDFKGEAVIVGSRLGDTIT